MSDHINGDKLWARLQAACRASIIGHVVSMDDFEAKLSALRSETPPLKDGDSWKLRECPHANWPYDEREAWKGGYYAAMCDIGPTLAMRTERGAMSEEDRIAGRHAYPGDD